jgi:hypothetical protein
MKKIAEELGTGDTFERSGIEYMLISREAGEALIAAHLIEKLFKRDWDCYPIGVVRLSSRVESGLISAREVTVMKPEEMKHGKVADELRRYLTSQHFVLGVQIYGDGKKAGRPELTLGEALYEDRMRAAKAVPGYTPVKETKKEDPVTEGDLQVIQVRKNAIYTVDASLVALQNSCKLFKKFGVDAELEEALKVGLKGMELYLKVRSRRDRLRRTARLGGKMVKCDRCGKQTTATIMSYFNTDILCEVCSGKERTHPKFEVAQAEEERQVRAGNYNFAGVGRPKDL